MLLVIDVGNTNIVYGLFEIDPALRGEERTRAILSGSELRHEFRVESSRGRTADEYAVTLRHLLAMRDVNASALEAAIVASVVPSLTETMVQVVTAAFHCPVMVVGPGIKTGMPILYENPKEVGADRIVNAVAAFERVQDGVIVVDFGTATTFDCVTPKGEYLGGVICPGIQISADALFARAAKLPRVEITKPAKVVGRNTIHSMQSGIIYGYVGLVDGMVERLREELGYPCRVLATGGFATVVAPLSKVIDEVDPILTLTGLRLIYDRNKSG